MMGRAGSEREMQMTDRAGSEREVQMTECS